MCHIFYESNIEGYKITFFRVLWVFSGKFILIFYQFFLQNFTSFAAFHKCFNDHFYSFKQRTKGVTWKCNGDGPQPFSTG